MNIKMSNISGVKLIPIHTVVAERGDLSAIELPEVIPFQVKRIFLVHNVSNLEIRGEHAHKLCWQFLIAASGSITVDVNDGNVKNTYVLDSTDKGLLIPPMIWGVQYNYSKDGSLLVLASHKFDSKDYIHDYNEFLELKKIT